MRYLTKEWYARCQSTGLHFGLRAHKRAEVFDENFYEHMRKRKEKAFLALEKEVYDIGPIFGLEQDGVVFIETAKEDSRPPFDVEKTKAFFYEVQQVTLQSLSEKIPEALYAQVADPRVLALGYCSLSVLKGLKKISKENRRVVDRILEAYYRSQAQTGVPKNLQMILSCHDRQVKEMKLEKKGKLRLMFTPTSDPTESAGILFHNVEVIKHEKPIEGSYWIYKEIYKVKEGYEIHILFSGEHTHEFTMTCQSFEEIKTTKD